ncbi:MAG: Unknown protein [uncultured Campylobacterales bacterium]|uniref:Uncharacterized protein n=1 Tax=uncultured Campylobacterales bacterium TaxID=352960 RepID=A0A6S6T408_9BACT|nr:MAG: Unknown protein [uncultured Campylobacterales bacterium]
MSLLIKMFLILGVIVYIFVFTYEDDIKKYKQNIKSQNIAKQELKNISKTELLKKEFLYNKKEQNIFNIARFSQNSKDELLSFTSRYFDDIKMKDISSDISSFQVKSDDMSKFYYFIEDLGYFRSVVEVLNDIEIVRGDNSFDISFKLKTYKDRVIAE